MKDVSKVIEEISKPPVEEIVTKEEFEQLLRENPHPVAYDGFEPSGLLHLGSGIQRSILTNRFTDNGAIFIMYIADWFAYLNKKFNGDMGKIRIAGQYFIEGFKACGMRTENVRFIWTSDMIKDSRYWETLLTLSSKATVNRILRSVTIAGREESEAREMSLLIYPLMQATDVLTLNNWKPVDICQLGMDQRKVNMLVRDIIGDMNLKKPVAIHHHLLLGLQKNIRMGKFDESEELNKEISFKMSKSKPESAIYIHDTEEEVKSKLDKAYCPTDINEPNPILELFKYIIFNKFDNVTIKREEKYGGNLDLNSYEELHNLYANGKIHPKDLKNAAADYINQILEPVREYFEKNEKAHELLEKVKSFNITR
ncbi:MAG: tyrosine--tRNA ligase [Candidatus Micrarchaeota archaeon]|nr:MAG: tyrosine--tRNA ligase [Candidatus Micrarchaeota archaeon]